MPRQPVDPHTHQKARIVKSAKEVIDLQYIRAFIICQCTKNETTEVDRVYQQQKTTMPI